MCWFCELIGCIDSGREFHNTGAALTKAMSPHVTLFVLGTLSLLTDLRGRLHSSSFLNYVYLP